MSKIYVGDIGTIFDFETDPGAVTGLDLTSYTLNIEFLKPSGTSTEVTAALKPGSLSIVRYTTINGTLNEAGVWKAQVKATLGSSVWLGETAEFTVYEVFK